MGNLFLLLGKRGLLDGQLLGTQVFEGAVVAAIAHQLAVVDVYRDVGHGIKKLAVMANDN